MVTEAKVETTIRKLGDSFIIHQPYTPREGWFKDYKEEPSFSTEAHEWEELGLNEEDWEW
jgi:hypothetical protein